MLDLVAARMRKTTLALGFVVGWLLANSPSWAIEGRAPLSCQDFHRSANGSWSPVRVVRIGSITIGPGVFVGRRVAIGGIDLAAMLERQCR